MIYSLDTFNLQFWVVSAYVERLNWDNEFRVVRESDIAIDNQQ